MNDLPATAVRPLKLSPLTIIVGGDLDSHHDVAVALIENHSQTEQVDSRHSVRVALAILLMGRTEEDIRNMPTMHFDNMVVTPSALFEILTNAFDKALGKTWPGIMLCEHMNEGALPEFDQIVLHGVADVETMHEVIDRFGVDDTTIIFCGPITKSSYEGARNIWLPSPELKSRMALLRKELGEV